MPKTSTDPVRYTVNGPTMGTRWSVQFFTASEFDTHPVADALQRAVDAVDVQMSTWRPESHLMRLNRLPPGTWLEVPFEMAQVLKHGLAIHHASGGAFDPTLGDAVRAWGFGPDDAEARAIHAAMTRPRSPASATLELAGQRVRRLGPVQLDLNGIAKGYGVDRLAETLKAFGIHSALAAIDGELRALGARPDGSAWSIAIEAPELNHRAPHSILTLHDAAVATSGDYRHTLTVQGHQLAHTMDPHRGAPLVAPPASVTVVAPTCVAADAWATALMVAGPEAGAQMAERAGLSALFLIRQPTGGVRAQGCGPLFAAAPKPRPLAAW